MKFIIARDAEVEFLQYNENGRKPNRIVFVSAIPHYANVFVSNIDPSVTVSDLNNLFNELDTALIVDIPEGTENKNWM